ncbi:MAG: rRNA maturation RNase YbeY [Sedimentisphaerales bacterium]|nr:rRNA maturation RNase YbeY [Sedimentisphaerales bacterium]
MPPAQENIVVQIAAEFGGVNVNQPGIEELVKTVCKKFELTEATVSIAIIDDTRFRELNARFRKSTSTSDCLSFDLSDAEDESQKLFELIVNGEMAREQAELRGHSCEAELALYVIHGLLHNLGFDDSNQTQAKRMHQTEDEILRQLGYGLVYSSQIKTREREPDPNG